MPLGHVSLAATPSTYKPMRDFYLSVLAPLGYTLFEEKEGCYLGLQTNYNPDFWLHCGGGGSGDGDGDDMLLVDPSLTADENRKRLGVRGNTGRAHVAFNVASRRMVDVWYRNAVKSGGIPNGEPGERPQYVKGYYAAFVLDPLGNNVEAVYFCPWWMQAMKAVPGVLTVLFGVVAGHVATGYAKSAGWM
ncbi:hypothetical protein N658DRAFT_513334 [Parathielavia hyrcaniae]|uniref:VOC domain-containing protein n=1 Tax=Parathielavia hyrcaniae TaxID=113614 RepID=A0AAN6Q6F0_9PEZI|nr:hypothetical protein N658DRAFT_513334 [Parathielavia hyrcaniae]